MLNAGRRYLGSGDLSGRVFVTSGLGGMSGAQAKAAVIAGCVGVIAEVSGQAATHCWGSRNGGSSVAYEYAQLLCRSMRLLSERDMSRAG